MILSETTGGRKETTPQAGRKTSAGKAASRTNEGEWPHEQQEKSGLNQNEGSSLNQNDRKWPYEH